MWSSNEHVFIDARHIVKEIVPFETMIEEACALDSPSIDHAFLIQGIEVRQREQRQKLEKRLHRRFQLHRHLAAKGLWMWCWYIAFCRTCVDATDSVCATTTPDLNNQCFIRALRSIGVKLLEGH